MELVTKVFGFRRNKIFQLNRKGKNMERNDFITLTKEEYAELLHAKVAFEFLQKFLQNNQYATLSDVKIAVEVILGIVEKERE